MAVQNFPSRSLHDLGLAAWFGGTLSNAVSLNRAAGETDRYSTAGRVTNAGWDAWTPVNAAAIGAHLVGAVGQLLGNRDRVAAQKGVAAMSVTKTVLTAAALGGHRVQPSVGAQGVAADRRSRRVGHRASRDDPAGRGQGTAAAEGAAVGRARDHRCVDRGYRVRR